MSGFVRTCDPTTFLHTPSFPIGAGTYDLAHADFDGDSYIDLISGNFDRAVVSVARNQTAGGTALFGPISEFGIASGTLAVDTADLNADGRPDIVATNFFNSSVSVLVNSSTGPGLIAFNQKVDFLVNDSPRSVAIADFDNDGRLDLAILGGSLAILRNTSTTPNTLSFDAPLSISLPGTVDQRRSVDVADLDADGKVDIVMAINTLSGSVSVARNTSSGPSISFANLANFALGGFPAQSVTVGDFDNDGRTDVAVGSFDLPFVLPLRNTSSGAANIGLSLQPRAYVGYFTSEFTLIDVEQDGKLDIAISSQLNYVSVLKNVGSPGAILFEPRITAGTGQSPQGITVADFNGDVTPDIVVSNYAEGSVSVIANRTPPGGRIRLEAREVVPMALTGEGPFSIAAADLDSDGLKDLVTANNISNNFSILRNLGREGSTLKFAQNVEINGAPNSRPYAVEVGDLDNDGKPDVVVANEAANTVSIFRNTSTSPGEFNFAPRLDFSVGVRPRDLIIIDLNRDGKLDIATSNTGSDDVSTIRNLSVSQGTIVFENSINHQVNYDPSSLAAGDFDRDGALDIVAANNVGTTISVLRNSSTLGGPIQYAPKVDLPVNLNPFSVVVADFDSDGASDIAVGNRTNSKAVISVFRNSSASFGTIEFAQKVDFDIENNGQFTATVGHLSVGDLDRDGNLDIVAMNQGNGVYVSMLRNSSSGVGSINFGTRVNVGTTGFASDLKVLNLDGDGYAEVFHSNYNSNTVGLLRNGCSQFVSSLFDYDADRKADLSVRRPSNNIWYLLQGTAGFTAMEWGVAGDRIVPADYDGDGRTDIAVFRPSEGKWYIFMSQTGAFQAFNWGQDGDLPVPTDRDNDGKTDLVVYRESNNTWYASSMATGPITSTVFGSAGDKPVVGDFDGDGQGDEAVFRPSNSTWYVLGSAGGFIAITWGQAGDIQTPADFDGDGKTDLAIFRPSTGQWFRNQSTAGFDTVNWGQAGDIPVAADYDGDGKADAAVFRPSSGTWYMNQSTAGFLTLPFGQDGDIPTPSAFIY